MVDLAPWASAFATVLVALSAGVVRLFIQIAKLWTENARLDERIKAEASRHNELRDTVDDIAKNMVRKGEWETAMGVLQEGSKRIERMIDRRDRRSIPDDSDPPSR